MCIAMHDIFSFLFCSFSDSQPSPSTIVDQSDVISQLATPILSLPRSDLNILISSQPGLLKFVLNGVRVLSEDIKKKLLGMEDSSAVLRMFWIVKLNPDRLSNLMEEEWTPILENPNTLFPLVVWFKTPAVIKVVRSFTNLDRVVQYIHMYRKIVFAARDKIPTKSVPKKESPPTEDRSPLPGGTPLPSILSLEGKTEQQSGKGLPVKKDYGQNPNAPLNGTENLSDKEKVPQTKGSEIKDSDWLELSKGDIDDLDHNRQNQDLGGQGAGNVNGRDEGRGADSGNAATKDGGNTTLKDGGNTTLKDGGNTALKDLKIGSDIFFDVNSDGKQELCVTRTHEPLIVGGVLHSLIHSFIHSFFLFAGGFESPKRSYGPFHILVVFLVVGGVIVMAYVCLHNRKKVG